VRRLSIVGDVTVGFPASRTGYGQATYGNTAPQTQRATWIIVDGTGRVTAFAGKVEYGQNIRTGLAVEVADELRVSMASVEVVLGDTARVPWDMGTFGSQSTARVGWQLRKAAATAREALLAMAADRLDLPVEDLEARDGAVVSRHDRSRSIPYADLIEADQEREIADHAQVTRRADFTQMGQSHLRRLDGIDRVTGAARYSQDILPEDVLYAAILHPPTYGATLRTIDLAASEALPGVVQVVEEGGIFAILAEDDETAALAARIARLEWDIPQGQPSRWDMPALLVESGQDGYSTQEAGDLDAGFKQADEVIEATYYIPYIAPMPMEPRAAVAAWEGDSLTVWAGTQRPFGLRAELASIFGMEESRIRVIAPEIGGGFGAKSPYGLAHDAARFAKAAGRPVRVAYTRAEETMWSNFRPAALIRIRAGVASDGRLVAWDSHAYHAGERVMIGRRGSETPYDAGNIRSMVYRSDSPLPSGSYRSLGAAVNHFAREVHMDDIAARVGRDPVEYRLAHLTEPRFRRVLEAAADDFGWSGPRLPDGRGAGIALGIDVGSYVATAAEVSVNGREVRVHRVSAALDCGLVVNPEGAANQMEGAIVMGLGGALFEASDFEAGRVLNPTFARYRVPRIVDAPRIDLRFVGDDETPSTGAGEPGIVPIAAAVSGAVFGATGVRHRELPIQRYLD